MKFQPAPFIVCLILIAGMVGTMIVLFRGADDEQNHSGNNTLLKNDRNGSARPEVSHTTHQLHYVIK
ncbi:Uncharacterised protein g10907 [Pycnogonum litorale]